MGFQQLQIRLGHFLYRNAYALYQPLYYRFKRRQDAGEIRLLQQLVKPGAVVLDIGANIGFYSGLLSSLVGPQGCVHSFEPDRENFRHLQQNCGRLRNVRLNNAAVAATSGVLKLYQSTTLNVDHRTYPVDEFAAEYTVNAVSIDEYLAGIGSDGRVDFIKIDIQGFEGAALAGMQHTLRRNAGIRLLSEFWPSALRQANSSARAYFDQLSALGFACHLLEASGPVPLTADRVTTLEQADTAQYFNILVQRHPMAGTRPDQQDNGLDQKVVHTNR